MLLVCNQKPTLMRAINNDEPRKKRPAFMDEDPEPRTWYVNAPSKEILGKPKTLKKAHKRAKFQASRLISSPTKSSYKKGEKIASIKLNDLPIFKQKNPLGAFTMKLFNLDSKKYEPAKNGVKIKH